MSEFAMWLSEILSSFDGSDLLAFVGGCIAMIVWKNVRAMVWNRGSHSDEIAGQDSSDTAGAQIAGRRVSLPEMNRKWLIWAVVVVAILGVMWSTLESGRAQDAQAQRMETIAVRLCEGSKVTRVEAKASQDLFFAALNVPPEIAALPPDHPDRKAWGQGIGLRYLGTLDDATAQRDKIQTGQHIDPDFWERYFGPDRPEPSCTL